MGHNITCTVKNVVEMYHGRRGSIFREEDMMGYGGVS